jgi:hypothetical protein
MRIQDRVECDLGYAKEVRGQLRPDESGQEPCPDRDANEHALDAEIDSAQEEDDPEDAEGQVHLKSPTKGRKEHLRTGDEPIVTYHVK